MVKQYSWPCFSTATVLLTIEPCWLNVGMFLVAEVLERPLT